MALGEAGSLVSLMLPAAVCKEYGSQGGWVPGQARLNWILVVLEDAITCCWESRCLLSPITDTDTEAWSAEQAADVGQFTQEAGPGQHPAGPTPLGATVIRHPHFLPLGFDDLMFPDPR